MEMNLPSTEKFKYQIKYRLTSHWNFWLSTVRRNKFGGEPINMWSGYHEKLRIGFVVMFHTTYCMYQDQITITSTSGDLESTSSMGIPQEIICIIDPIYTTFRDMQILQELLYIWKQTRLTISIEPIIHGLINIIIVYPHQISTKAALYYFNNTHKYVFVIWI